MSHAVRVFVFTVLGLSAVVARGASPALSPSNGLDFDLGHGLAFHRVHSVPADLPTAETARLQPCVLDLRYVDGDAAAAAALVAWLKFHATARAPVFILANGATSGALLTPLAGPRPGASIVVIGGAAPGFAPDIALKISDEAERKAYDALEQGTKVAALLTEISDKPRNDEARLAKERGGDAAAAEEFSAPPADPDAAAKPKPPPPLIDAALQRAVQLHRSLVALKKL